MRVVISGNGLVSSVGVGAREAFDRMLEGVVGAAGETPGLEVEEYLGKKGLRHWDRTSLLLGAAARMALNEAGLVGEELPYTPDRLGVVAGSTHGSIQAIAEFDQEAVKEGPKYVNPQAFANTVINQPAGRLAMFFDMPGLNTTIATGRASALDALDYSATMLRGGRIGALLCGSALGNSPEIDEGYRKAGRLVAAGNGSIPFSEGSKGAWLAEGSAVFVLETEDGARARGASPIAWISGYGSAFSITHDGPRLAMEAALRSAGLGPEQIGGVIAFASGSPVGDAEEGAAIQEVFGDRVAVTAPKAMTGDCLEASGAIDIAVAIQAVRRGLLPPIARLEKVHGAFAGLDLVRGEARPLASPHVLVNARDDEGQCASVIISSAETLSEAS